MALKSWHRKKVGNLRKMQVWSHKRILIGSIIIEMLGRLYLKITLHNRSKVRTPPSNTGLTLKVTLLAMAARENWPNTMTQRKNRNWNLRKRQKGKTLCFQIEECREERAISFNWIRARRKNPERRGRSTIKYQKWRRMRQLLFMWLITNKKRRKSPSRGFNQKRSNLIKKT